MMSSRAVERDAWTGNAGPVARGQVVAVAACTAKPNDLSWLNWCLTGSCLFSLMLILFFRESYDRLYLDVFVSA
ncbi:unnamed protein product [Arctogadus glacialis]